MGSDEVMWTVPRESGCSKQTRRDRRCFPSGGAEKNWTWSSPPLRSSWHGIPVGMSGCACGSKFLRGILTERLNIGKSRVA